uniref:SCP domain-containing protein n=1 Tax=Mesocestoides corti TaxID=53468 RepID=A0A5K3EFN1_MESCO
MQRSICLVALMLTVAGKALTTEERCKILEYHRKMREDVVPEARNMLLMSYSTELEELAQNWLESCAFTFPYDQPEYHDVAHFVLLGTGDQPVSCETVGEFVSLKQHYNYTINDCTKPCYQYKRMVWATTDKVGCSQKLCQNSIFFPKPQYIFTCFYKPADVMMKDRPYLSGSICTECPQGFSCYRKQCTNLTSLATDTCTPLTLTTPVATTEAVGRTTIKTTSTSTSLSACIFLNNASLIVFAFAYVVVLH